MLPLTPARESRSVTIFFRLLCRLRYRPWRTLWLRRPRALSLVTPVGEPMSLRPGLLSARLATVPAQLVAAVTEPKPARAIRVAAVAPVQHQGLAVHRGPPGAGQPARWRGRLDPSSTNAILVRVAGGSRSHDFPFFFPAFLLAYLTEPPMTTPPCGLMRLNPAPRWALKISDWPVNG